MPVFPVYSNGMFGRKREGSVICPSCGLLVGVNDDECLNCGRRNPGMWGFAPVLAQLGRGDLGDAFIQLVIIACSLFYVASLLVDAGGIRMSGFLNFLSPSTRGLFLLGASGAIPVFQFDRWWTVLSASWLHGGILHIFFNMYYLRQLVGPAVNEFYGTSRMIIIYTLSGVVGFLASSLAGYYLVFMPGFLRGAGFTIGASASLCGLIGALWYYGRRSGSRVVADQARSWIIMLLLFGFFIPGIDNWAHLGGLAGGYLTARWLDPLQPERLDDTVGAIACLTLSALAVVYSAIHGLQFL